VQAGTPKGAMPWRQFVEAEPLGHLIAMAIDRRYSAANGRSDGRDGPENLRALARMRARRLFRWWLCARYGAWSVAERFRYRDGCAPGAGAAYVPAHLRGRRAFWRHCRPGAQLSIRSRHLSRR